MAAFDTSAFDPGTFDAAAIVYPPVAPLGWVQTTKARVTWGSTGDTTGAVWTTKQKGQSTW